MKQWYLKLLLLLSISIFGQKDLVKVFAVNGNQSKEIHVDFCALTPFGTTYSVMIISAKDIHDFIDLRVEVPKSEYSKRDASYTFPIKSINVLFTKENSGLVVIPTFFIERELKKYEAVLDVGFKCKSLVVSTSALNEEDLAQAEEAMERYIKKMKS